MAHPLSARSMRKIAESMPEKPWRKAPEALGTQIQADTDRCKRIVKETNLKIERPRAPQPDTSGNAGQLSVPARTSQTA